MYGPCAGPLSVRGVEGSGDILETPTGGFGSHWKLSHVSCQGLLQHSKPDFMKGRGRVSTLSAVPCCVEEGLPAKPNSSALITGMGGFSLLRLKKIGPEP